MKFGGIIAPRRLKCPHLLSIGVLVAMRVPWHLASALLLLAACLPADSQVVGGGVPDPDALLEFLNSSAFVGIVDKYSASVDDACSNDLQGELTSVVAECMKDQATAELGPSTCPESCNTVANNLSAPCLVVIRSVYSAIPLVDSSGNALGSLDTRVADICEFDTGIAPAPLQESPQAAPAPAPAPAPAT